MKMTIAVIFACMLLASTTLSIGGKAQGGGDWLSGGYVVTPYYPTYYWGPGNSYSTYYNSAISDPWYRNVAWPYLSNYYWPPSYYQNGLVSYPAYYYYPASYWYYPAYGSIVYR